MKPRRRFPSLVLGQAVPVRGPVKVQPRHPSARSRRHSMQDRPVERCVDDFVVRQDPLLFNTPTLNGGPVPAYGAKSEIVQ